jgi:hypothetical protein
VIVPTRGSRIGLFLACARILGWDNMPPAALRALDDFREWSRERNDMYRGARLDHMERHNIPRQAGRGKHTAG